MSGDRNISRVQLLAAVLGAGLVSSWTTALLISPRQVQPPPGTYEPAPDFNLLNQRLDQLARALQPLSARTPTPPAEPGTERMPVEETEAWDEVAASLQDIRALVARQGAQVRSGSPEVVTAALQLAGTQWQRLGDLRQQISADRTAARQAHMFLSQAMVLQRYGKPTEIGVGQQGQTFWQYRNGLPRNNGWISVTFYFVDGYVSLVE